ncbi:MAG TPA: universal stress protein [Blastocatellia bacterium]|nr:universal stress protein [Blastocatellia bacterium]
MSINTILVSTDFSDNAQVAFEKACELARLLKARLHVLHVQDESALRIAVKEGLLESCETDEAVRAAVERLTAERFARMFAAADCADVDITHLSERGEAAAQTLGYARRIHADMIVIGRHGEGVLGNLISAVLGRVAEVIIRKSPCPVLVVRRDHKKP